MDESAPDKAGLKRVQFLLLAACLRSVPTAQPTTSCDGRPILRRDMGIGDFLSQIPTRSAIAKNSAMPPELPRFVSPIEEPAAGG